MFGRRNDAGLTPDVIRLAGDVGRLTEQVAALSRALDDVRKIALPQPVEQMPKNVSDAVFAYSMGQADLFRHLDAQAKAALGRGMKPDEVIRQIAAGASGTNGR